MKLVLIFLILLQVWTALCERCITRNEEIGYCRRDCNTVEGSEALSRCSGSTLYCCPPTIPSTVDLKFPPDCGHTPLYPADRILEGNEAEADYYSWLASLQYANQSVHPLCAGSVINSRYVLTTAHCVTGTGRL